MITAIESIKGGVAKTTTAMVLATGYARLGKKVLVVDTDAQANITDALLPEYDFEGGAEKNFTLNQVLRGTEDLENCIYKSSVIENVDVIPSNFELFSVLYELQGQGGSDFRLSKVLQSLEYDEIIIDCNPSVSKATYNVIYAADRILIPSDLGKKSIAGFNKTLKLIEQANDALPMMRDIDIRLVLCKVHKNRNKYKELIPVIREKFGDLLLNVIIRYQDSPIQDSEDNYTSILDKKRTGVAQDYEKFLEELLGLN